jgi:serine protease Do
MEDQKDTKTEHHDRSVGPATRLSAGLTATIILMVLVLGFGSGAAGSYFVYRHFVGTLPHPQPPAQTSSSDAVAVVAKSSPAVVSIIVSENVASGTGDSTSQFYLSPYTPQQPVPSTSAKPDFQPVGAGSGFFITSDGMILTNKHVVEDTAAHYAVYTNDGKRYSAQVLSRDPLNDLALVKVNITGAPTLQLANSDEVKIGEQAIAIGNSLGEYRNTVTMGIVSGIDRTVSAGDGGQSETLEDVIQTDAAINPGNSGGPLIDVDGRVIGVNTAIDQQGQLVGFAIPANDAARDIALYQKLGKIVKPFLGVQYVLLDPEVAQQNSLPVSYGAWIDSGSSDGSPAVVPGSAADKAGLKDGDIIVSVNGTLLNEKTTLESLIQNMNPGGAVTMDVLRGTKHLTVHVTLGEK